MIRNIAVSELTENLTQMCIEANHVLSGDMDRALKCAVKTEESPLGTKILEQLQENTKDKLSAIPQSFSDKILEKF